jgi:hypothetical protein
MAVVSGRHVLAGGEGLAGDDLVLRDLHDLLCPRVGDVHQDKRWSMAGGEVWRRPCRCARDPGEGPANMEGQGAHEHRERVGMLFPYSIWSETGRRVVLDGGVGVGFLPAVMAAGVMRARAMEGGEGGAGSLQGNDVVMLVPLVGVEGSCTGGSTGGQAAAEERACRRCGPTVLVEEIGIGSLGELRWVTAVLLLHWNGVVAVNDDQGRRRGSGEGR